VSWPMVKLGDVVTVNPRAPKELDSTQIVSFVGMASVSEDGQLLSEEPRVLEETKKGFTYFAKSDVLLAKITPCFENGKCLRANQISNLVGFGSTEFHVLRPDESRLDATYLFYMIWSEQFRVLGAASMSGAAGQKRVGSDFLKNFEIPLPPLAEQKRIAAILDKADAIRRKRQQAIQLADDFLRAVFLEMFGDPVTNPKGWEVKPLSELVDKLGDGLHGTPVYEETGGYNFINGNNLRHGRIQINESVKKVSEIEYVKHKKELNINTMFVSINGTIGNVAFYRNEPVVLGKSVCYFNIANGAIDREYLFHLISSEYFVRYATSKATGSTIKNVSLKTMREFPVPIPDKSTQQLFVTYIEIVKSLNCMEDESVSDSDSLFNSLSKKAFSGQL
jgi:type I restriction enzyme S subunit